MRAISSRKRDPQTNSQWPSERANEDRGLLFWCAANVLAEALIYFSAEKGVGVRIWLLMLLVRHPAAEPFDVVQRYRNPVIKL
jgi:hypothetical protein